MSDYIYETGTVGPYYVTIDHESWHPETREDCITVKVMLGEWEAFPARHYPPETKIEYIRHEITQLMYRDLAKWKESVGWFRRGFFEEALDELRKKGESPPSV